MGRCVVEFEGSDRVDGARKIFRMKKDLGKGSMSQTHDDGDEDQ
jgi:hypothetical protein